MVVCVPVRAQPLHKTGDFRGAFFCVVNVGSLKDPEIVEGVLWSYVAEVGDRGDVLKIDSCMFRELSEAIVDLHVLREAIVNVGADARHER